MKIYNTLTRKKETFKPIKKGKIGMYVCGPTVYDEPHIGHARAAYIFEIIRNYFEYKGFKVKFVKNITDVDDKIITRAKQELPDLDINQAVEKIATKYTQRYVEDMDALGIRRPTYAPRASEHIEQMQKYVAGLIEKDFAYEVDGDVYFDVRKAKDYGKLSHQDLNQMRDAVRIEKNEKKRDPLDFALWKKAREDEPSWVSPWGKGRPGWHIECSVMSSKYLGDEFDIHAGGMDLIFPHHENEIAQSQCYSGKRFAHYWMHNGLLTTNQQKMAKSLGNFVTIKDFINKYNFHPDILKLFFLQAHYAQPIDFNWGKMEEKREALDRLRVFLETVRRREDGKAPPAKTILKKPVLSKELRKKIEQAREDFEKYMDDDFNTPNAIAILFEVVSVCNKVMYDISFTKKHLAPLKYAAKVIKEFGKIFGISFTCGPLSMPEREIESLVGLRKTLKKEKMFDKADQIRKELKDRGIVLEDTKEGTVWRRKA